MTTETDGVYTQASIMVDLIDDEWAMDVLSDDGRQTPSEVHSHHCYFFNNSSRFPLLLASTQTSTFRCSKTRTLEG